MGLKKTLLALTAGTIAGLFLAKKPGSELKKELKVTAEKAKEDVSKKLARLETITRAAYEEVVSDVVAFYQKAGKLTRADAKLLKADLVTRWKEVEAVLTDPKSREEKGSSRKGKRRTKK